MKILVIDNYDSFTYNIVQIIGKYLHSVEVEMNDRITHDRIKKIGPDKIIISPGPGKPEDSIMSLEVIETYYKSLPILGVCLGHQCIGIKFGGKVIKAPVPRHGKLTQIEHDGLTIFNDIPQKFDATLYHSLMVEENSLPNELEISARSIEGIVMGIRHKNYPLEGVQFHPEAILTKHGETIIKNWLSM